MLPVLQIGPVGIPVPAFSLLLGVWLGLSLAERHAPRFGVDGNRLFSLALTALLSGLAGARLAYAARYSRAFIEAPLNLLSPRPELLDPWGGLAAGLIGALIYAQRKEMRLWPTLNALTPAFAVFAVALGISQLASGDAFGAPTAVPWAIELWGARRHPTQIYETLLALLILAACWPAGPLGRRPDYFLIFTAASALARIFIEAFRGDSVLVFSGFRLAQLAAWLVLAASLWLMGRRFQKGPHHEPAS